MGKFAESISPKEGASVMADPKPHEFRDALTGTAIQGVRTTKGAEKSAGSTGPTGPSAPR